MQLNNFFVKHVELPEKKFIITYRLSKGLMRRVINMVSPYMEPPKTSRGLTIERKFCLFLC